MKQCEKILYSRTGHRLTVWRMRIACWMPNATHTHSDNVILVAFPQQQTLHERASVFRYTYFVYLFNIKASSTVQTVKVLLRSLSIDGLKSSCLGLKFDALRIRSSIVSRPVLATVRLLGGEGACNLNDRRDLDFSLPIINVPPKTSRSFHSCLRLDYCVM